MPGRRAFRFALEVAFLVAIAVALTVAHLRAPVVAGVMLLGWLVAALFEWASALERAHFGRGLPPRYYVPQAALPPAHPIEQEVSGYPAARSREEDLTWIVPPAVWGEVLEDWPVLDSSSVGEETQIALPDQIDQDLPAAPDEAPEAEHTSEVDLAGSVERGAATAPDDDDEGQAPAPVAADAGAEAPAAGEPAGARPGLAAAAPTATHRLDPLAVTVGGRFRRRRDQDEGGQVEVPGYPPAIRALPGRAAREDEPRREPAGASPAPSGS